MLSCDLVVASEEATFGIPEVKRGLAAAAGGLMRLPARIPRTVAMELALTGDPMSAADAHRWGLVNHLTPVGGALEGARELAARIGANGPLAVRASKQVIVVLAGLELGGDVGAPGRDPGPGALQRGRPRGRRGLRGEARPGVEGPLTRAG